MFYRNPGNSDFKRIIFRECYNKNDSQMEECLYHGRENIKNISP